MSKSMVWAGAVGLIGALASFAGERSAAACGGCFAPPGPSTQVTAHRMAFALSSKRTILWDQIQYVGNPSSFGWVLPIRGAVDVGVSSDELFQRLETYTQPQINPPPPPTCPPPEKICRTRCYGAYDDAPSAGADGAAFSADATAPGVEVWGTSVVGPYEATQLSATDSTALKNWLKDHGYTLPDAILPVIDQYITGGFGFLAVKLVPDAGVDRMVPIRIAFDGSSPQLPLRMVAAGTGANVGIKLFVLGEGRWEAKNFPNGEVKTEDLEWDWAAMGSNFGPLENSLITSNPNIWITETSNDYTKSTLVDGLSPGTTTTEAGTVFSKDTDQTEIERAFGTRSSLTVTRLFAQLPKSALSADLDLQASIGGKIPSSRQATKQKNYFCTKSIEVDCPGITPTAEDCAGGTGVTNPFDPFGSRGKNGAGGSSTGTFGCNSGNSGTSSSVAWLGLAIAGVVAFGAARRRFGR